MNAQRSFKKFTDHLHLLSTSKCSTQGTILSLMDTDNWHIAIAQRASFSFFLISQALNGK